MEEKPDLRELIFEIVAKVGHDQYDRAMRRQEPTIYKESLEAADKVMRLIEERS